MDIKTDTNKKYGILLSGGIDSAVLLYLLIKSNPAINIQPFTIAKTDGATLYADPIIKHFNSKFSLAIPPTIIVGDPTVHHREQSKTAVVDIFTKHTDIDMLYIGINRNPPELADDPHAPQRDTKSTHPKIVFPFIDLYKTNVLQFMYDNKQQDLLALTHTCTEQQYGRCNKCWQCRERMWAFRQLDRIDTGLL